MRRVYDGQEAEHTRTCRETGTRHRPHHQNTRALLIMRENMQDGKCAVWVINSQSTSEVCIIADQSDHASYPSIQYTPVYSIASVLVRAVSYAASSDLVSLANSSTSQLWSCLNAVSLASAHLFILLAIAYFRDVLAILLETSYLNIEIVRVSSNLAPI